MNNKKLSGVTVIVIVVATVGLATAMLVPPLLRARMPARYVRTPMEQDRATPTATHPYAPRVGEAGAATGTARGNVPTMLAHREMALGPPAAMNTEAYTRIDDNAFLAVSTNPLSTFSIDVDTASYANVRRFLRLASFPRRTRSGSRS